VYPTKDHVLSQGASLPWQDATSAVSAGSDDSAELDGYRSLLEWLEEAVPGPRRRCGIRHRAAVVLAFAVAAVLAGADSMTAITGWAADAPSDVLAALDARCDRRCSDLRKCGSDRTPIRAPVRVVR